MNSQNNNGNFVTSNMNKEIGNKNNVPYYLNKGVDVLCWNYRGYGYSTGKATFNNLRSDVIEIFDAIEKRGVYTDYRRYHLHHPRPHRHRDQSGNAGGDRHIHCRRDDLRARPAP